MRHTRGGTEPDFTIEPSHGRDLPDLPDVPDTPDIEPSPCRDQPVVPNTPDPVGSRIAARHRSHAKVPREPDPEPYPGLETERSSTALRTQPGQRKGFTLVAALVAASAGLTGGLVWGLHLLPGSSTPRLVAPVGDSLNATRAQDFTSPGAIKSREPATDPDDPTELDPSLEGEGGLSESEEPEEDPSLDEEPSSAGDLDDLSSISGTGSARASRSAESSGGLDVGDSSPGRSDGATSGSGSRAGQQSRGEDYRRTPRYPDGASEYDRGPDRSRTRLPGLGGLSQR